MIKIGLVGLKLSDKLRQLYFNTGQVLHTSKQRNGKKTETIYQNPWWQIDNVSSWYLHILYQWFSTFVYPRTPTRFENVHVPHDQITFFFTYINNVFVILQVWDCNFFWNYKIMIIFNVNYYFNYVQFHFFFQEWRFS